MLFNSYEFLLLFLPVVLIGYFLLGLWTPAGAAGWLAASSLFFYGWWDARYLGLLIGSIAGNYLFGKLIASHARTVRGRWLLATSVTINLVLLAYYKYFGFFLESFNLIAKSEIPIPEIILPLGISFFTFTQIAYLVDTYRGLVKEYRAIHYLLFVTYFPHLIAGPILHHKEMMPQFAYIRNYTPRINSFLIGSSIFIIGLAKKVLIADNLSPYSNIVFDKATNPTFFIAWGGALAYTFQLYFDFSGYSDMAIGLSRLFNIKLPLNFNSPYKAANIVDFWRCWHITLSRFLRDYLYFPLGGNRRGSLCRYINLITTMLLGGLWHGAGWNFVIWGGLHGFYLCINHLWMAMHSNRTLPKALPRPIAVFITFIAVVFAWVFFRAVHFDQAIDIVSGMTGFNGFALPEALGIRIGTMRSYLESSGIKFFLGGGQQFFYTYSWIIIAAIMAFLAPNSQELLARFAPALTVENQIYHPSQIRWSLHTRWAVGLGLIFTACFLSLSRPTEFLYFQF